MHLRHDRYPMRQVLLFDASNLVVESWEGIYLCAATSSSYFNGYRSLARCVGTSNLGITAKSLPPRSRPCQAEKPSRLLPISSRTPCIAYFFATIQNRICTTLHPFLSVQSVHRQARQRYGTKKVHGTFLYHDLKLSFEHLFKA